MKAANKPAVEGPRFRCPSCKVALVRPTKRRATCDHCGYVGDFEENVPPPDKPPISRDPPRPVAVEGDDLVADIEFVRSQSKMYFPASAPALQAIDRIEAAIEASRIRADEVREALARRTAKIVSSGNGRAEVTIRFKTLDDAHCFDSALSSLSGGHHDR